MDDLNFQLLTPDLQRRGNEHDLRRHSGGRYLLLPLRLPHVLPDAEVPGQDKRTNSNIARLRPQIH